MKGIQDKSLFVIVSDSKTFRGRGFPHLDHRQFLLTEAGVSSGAAVPGAGVQTADK